MDGWVVLDDTRSGCATVFSNPTRTIVARSAAEVTAALSAIQHALDSGHHLAGYFSYELGFVLEPCLESLLPADRTLPLLWFAQFDSPPVRVEGVSAAALWPCERAYATPATCEWNRATYRARFDSVMKSIRAGDIYQANLSMRAKFHLTGSPRALYGRLREHAQVTYGAFVDDGEHQLLSFSPELFFAIDPRGTITARPMKGTARRDPDETVDRALRDGLRASAKDRAENLMIVDLVRNDLGRFAASGSVEVPELFTVETYPTVHQLTSTIRATVPTECGIVQVLQALFPCGSVTGAPKIRAMQIIRGLEDSARGAYCGAIGAFAPDGSARFNVAIRTITITGGEGELGIGGAVVADSDPNREYDECLLKARFFEAERRPVALVETMAYAARAWPLRRRHLERLSESARALGIPFDLSKAVSTLDAAVDPAVSAAHRVRLCLQEDGTLLVETSEMPQRIEPMKFLVWPGCIPSADPLNRHKTTWRDTCREALGWAQVRGANEAILLNERGEISEGTYTNVFIERSGQLVTPPLSSGALPGCLRAELLASGRCTEAVLTIDDLRRASRIFLGNSLRGLVRAEMQVPGRPAVTAAETKLRGNDLSA